MKQMLRIPTSGQIIAPLGQFIMEGRQIRHQAGLGLNPGSALPWPCNWLLVSPLLGAGWGTRG